LNTEYTCLCLLQISQTLNYLVGRKSSFLQAAVQLSYSLTKSYWCN